MLVKFRRRGILEDQFTIYITELSVYCETIFHHIQRKYLIQNSKISKIYKIKKYYKNSKVPKC
jgi:hypothetical protein